MTTGNWRDIPIVAPAAGPGALLRALWRGALVAAICLTGLALTLLLRLVERPLHGLDRPWTPHITQAVCRWALRVLGLPLTVTGQPMSARGAVVANHASWLDIFVLNSVQRVYFVSKAEVASWPFIGWLARATGTVFIARRGAEAKRQQRLLEERLHAGHVLLFFPEGTSTDSLRILPFKSSLFEAFHLHGLDQLISIQPVTVVYHAPQGQDPRFYGWWGEMALGPHLFLTLAAARQGRVEVILHPEVPARAFAGRKDLARYCENVIRTSHPLALAAPQGAPEDAGQPSAATSA